MTTYLLDVNVLLALTDSLHVHHDAAHRWFAAKGQQGWATCPLTENGFVRIASHPSYPNPLGHAGAVLEHLRSFCGHPGHSFWPADVTLRDVLRPTAVFTHRQVTDLYLVALAVAHGGRLATFDKSIPLSLVPGSDGALERLDP